MHICEYWIQFLCILVFWRVISVTCYSLYMIFVYMLFCLHIVFTYYFVYIVICFHVVFFVFLCLHIILFTLFCSCFYAYISFWIHWFFFRVSMFTYYFVYSSCIFSVFLCLHIILFTLYFAYIGFFRVSMFAYYFVYIVVS